MRETNKEVKELFPIVEHFIPRHQEKARGEKHIVIACHWCDKTKGPLAGDMFLMIVEEEVSRYPRFVVAQMYIAARCKKLIKDQYVAMRCLEEYERNHNEMA